MDASTVGLVGLFAVQSAVAPTAVVPAGPDVTIKTRQTIDRQSSSIPTTIVYRKGARLRTETISDVTPQLRGITSPRRTFLSATVIQCDERRTAELNDEARTYAYLPIEDPPSYGSGICWRPVDILSPRRPAAM
jgi:hypothetical protein